MTNRGLCEKLKIFYIYGVLLVCYYWMWARRDWHSYYETIQNTVVIFTVVFLALQASRIHKYSKEEKDELAIRSVIFCVPDSKEV